MLILVIIFMMALGSLVLYSYYYGDEVRQFVLTELNKQLDVEVQVDDISFSVLQNFPHASVIFKGVRSNEQLSGQQKQMINAGEISLLFNMWNLVTGNYEIDKLRIDKAFLNLEVGADGETNFSVFKHKSKAEGSQVAINLKEVILNNVEVSFIHYPAQQEYLFGIAHGRLRGTFGGKSNAFNFKGDLHSGHIKSGNNIFLSNKDLALDLAMETNDGFEQINISRGNIDLQGLQIDLTGTVNTTVAERGIDLNIVSGETRLSTLLSMIPDEFLKPLEPYKMDGQIKLNAQLKGNFSGDRLPAALVNFQFNKGRLTYPRTDLQLNDIALQGSFDNGKLRKKQSFKLVIDDFSTTVNHSLIKGRLTINNFENPEIEAGISSSFDLNDVQDLISSDTVTSITGNMDLDLHFKNRLKSFREFTIHDFISSYTSGSLNVKQVAFKLKGSPLDFRDFDGTFRFNNKDLEIEHFSGRVSQSDFSMQGYFRNVLAWAFLPDQPLYIRTDVKSDRIFLDELLAYPGDTDNSSSRLRFSGNVNYDIDLTVGNFQFRKFNATGISGNLMQSRKVLQVKQGHFESMQGKVDISGSINGIDPEEYVLHCAARTTDVNIRQLFEHFGNFGQDNLTSDQLNGTVTAQTDYTSGLTPDLTVDPASVRVVSDLVINDGELIGYTPLYKLSGFIDKDELRHIRFSELSNRIVIDNEIIRIPHMAIESSTLDLELSGTHTFDNVIDYHVKLKMADVINRNKKSKPEDIGDNFVKEDDIEPRLFLSLTGDVSDPVIKYDSRAVKEKIAGDLANEKVEFKKILKDEFGAKKNLNPEKSADNPRKDPGKDFILGWDETRKDSVAKAVIPTPTDQKKSQAEKPKKKEFIISWDEEKDTIR